MSTPRPRSVPLVIPFPLSIKVQSLKIPEDVWSRINPVRGESATLLVEAELDPVMRNVLTWFVGSIGSELATIVGNPTEENLERLPVQPFDAVFFVTVVRRAFKNSANIRALLDGKTVNEIAGFGDS